MGAILPVDGLTIFSSVCGSTLPTVVTRNSTGSSILVRVMVGDASVNPYPMVISRQCILSTTRFMISIGQGAPAMMPVRREVRSNCRNAGCSSSPINIVGTPCKAVQRSSWTARSVDSGSKYAAGTTMVAPLATQAMLPKTMPKQ